MSGGERVGHRGVRGGGREEIRSRVGPTTDFSTTREKSACRSPVRNPGRASDVWRGALPFIFSELLAPGRPIRALASDGSWAARFG
jgi:hypothetical protein